MQKIITFTSTLLIFIFTACESDDDYRYENDYLVINGIEQSLENAPGNISITYAGDGLTYDPATGITTSVYTDLRIQDPDNQFLGNFNNQGISQYLFLRFITHPNPITTNLSTVTALWGIDETNVIATYSIGGQPVYAHSDQNITIQYLPQQTIVEFTNVTFGSNVFSGKFTYMY
ncbi:MAG: hypothetical protein ITG00_01450 [Flavobacterium sp.]|nr:hypothetical protein [Flavobacterium sp.]